MIVPFRGGCEHRERAWEWVQSRYSDYPWQVVTGTMEGPWCKAEAVEDGLRRASGDILLIADADVWCDTIPDAVRAVEQSAPWAVPHLMLHRLSEAATNKVFTGAAPAVAASEPDGHAERIYRGHMGGGVTVIPRHTYNSVPLDRRFVGWGHEDDAWSLALHRLVGSPVRLEADMWHLWHPPQPRDTRRRGSRPSEMLFRRYKNATLPEDMRNLIDEVQAPASS